MVADIIRVMGSYELVGFLDDINPERHRTEFCGASVLGGQEQLDILRRQNVKHLLLGIGDNHARLRLAGLARAKGYALATAIHPRAIIAKDARIGAGTAIMAGVAVNPDVKIGENVILNTCASVDHECVIEDGAHVSGGARLGGGITLGRASTVELGAIVAARVSIGAASVVGAGSLVLHDIPAGVLAYGTPARPVRKLEQA